MAPVFLLVALAALPVLTALILRVSAVFLFASIAAGSLVVSYLSDDVILALNAFTKHKNVPMITQLTLLILPVVLTMFFLRKSLPRSKVLLHLMPLVGCGLTLAVLALPLLPNSVQTGVFKLPAGNILRQSQDLVVSITAVLILLLAWHSYRHQDAKHKKHH